MADESYELSDEWQDWVIDNALRGAHAQELIESLREEELSDELAEREVLRILSSRAFKAAVGWRRRSLRFEKVNALKRALHEGHAPPEIERRSGVSPHELRARYLAHGQPVVLSDVVSDWPALTRWTDSYLKERLGELQVTCCRGRDAERDPCVNIKRFFVEMSFAEFIDEVANAGVSNDLYLVGNNRFIEREGASTLLDDLDDRIHAYLDAPVSPKRCSLWIGPAGTLTELHHDPTSVLYAQVRGEKRFRLLSPHCSAALLSAKNTYPQRPLEELAAEAGDRVYEVLLKPGELLLLPAGWWHEVSALTPSISLGIVNIKGPTSFKWYYPGLVTGIG